MNCSTTAPPLLPCEPDDTRPRVRELPDDGDDEPRPRRRWDAIGVCPIGLLSGLSRSIGPSGAERLRFRLPSERGVLLAPRGCPPRSAAAFRLFLAPYAHRTIILLLPHHYNTTRPTGQPRHADDAAAMVH